MQPGSFQHDSFAYFRSFRSGGIHEGLNSTLKSAFPAWAASMFRDAAVTQLPKSRDIAVSKPLIARRKFPPVIDNKRLTRAYQAREFSRFIGVSRPIGSEAFSGWHVDREAIRTSSRRPGR